jgi:hypothetical protein
MVKLYCSYDSVKIILQNILTEWAINCHILCDFLIPSNV